MSLFLLPRNIITRIRCCCLPAVSLLFLLLIWSAQGALAERDVFANSILLRMTAAGHKVERGGQSGESALEALFHEEMQQASAKLKWHGEALAPDTLYAVTLMGVSWEPAWGHEHLFSLAWGEMRKIPGYKQRAAGYASQLRELQSGYERRDFRRVVGQAVSVFSLDEIACDPNLKAIVGESFLELQQPERAFPIFAAPFEPSRDHNDTYEVNRRSREGAFLAAQRAGLRKEAVAFALSLLLEPGTQEAALNTSALHYLEGVGVNIDRILLGILQAPDRLRGLPAYAYAAGDLLTLRATPRLLPFFQHLAGVDDVYLRSRALLGLGIISYRARRNDPSDWASHIVMTPLREYGVSVEQRRMIAVEALKAARSDKYRLRAAACLAIALLGDEADIPLLQKLAADRAYLLSTETEAGHARRIWFPVRMAAEAALARYGVVSLFKSSGQHSDKHSGEALTGKILETARHGGQDVTGDHSNLRREIASFLLISPIDATMATPLRILSANMKH